MPSVTFNIKAADAYFAVKGQLRKDGTLDQLSVIGMNRDITPGERPRWQLEYGKGINALPTLAQANLALRHFAYAILDELGSVEDLSET